MSTDLKNAASNSVRGARWNGRACSPRQLQWHETRAVARVRLITVRVAMTGSSGLIGSALATRLEVGGHEVTRIVRRAVAPGENALRWDPGAGTIDDGGLEGLDAVVNLAGAGVGDRRWTAARKQVVLESRTQGTALLARTLAHLEHPPRVLVSASAVGFYGDRGDAKVTEQDGPGSDFLAKVCQRWEAAAAPAADAGIRVALARTGLVLSLAGGALPKLLPLFRFGLGGRFGPGSQWWSWISLDDEVGALGWMLEHDQAGPVNLTAPNPTTNREFTRILASVLSRPAALPVPRFGPELLLGTELAQALLFTSARVQPAVLEAGGYAFTDNYLEDALRGLLRSPAPARPRRPPQPSN